MSDENLERLLREHHRRRTTLLDERAKFEHRVTVLIIVGLLFLAALGWLVFSQ
jgi:hypothetical protein